MEKLFDFFKINKGYIILVVFNIIMRIRGMINVCLI